MWSFILKKAWLVDVPNLSRKFIISINCIRNNYTSLDNSLYKCHIVNSDLCKCRLGPATIEHIFWQCELYEIKKKIMHKLDI